MAGATQVLWLHNKVDLLDTPPVLPADALAVSARSGQGLAELHRRLLALSGVVVRETAKYFDHLKTGKDYEEYVDQDPSKEVKAKISADTED